MKAQRFFPAIGVAIFIYILWNMDLKEVYNHLQSIDLMVLSAAIALMVPVILLKSLKWNVLTRACGIRHPFRKSVLGWLVGFSIGIVTPGRLGDLSRAYYLKEEASLGTGLTTVVVDRIIDIIVLFVLTITGLSLLLATYTIGNIIFPIAVLFVTLLALALAFTRKGFVAYILRPVFRRLVPEKYKSKLGTLFTEFYRGVGLMGKKKSLVAFSVIICAFTWSVSIFQYYIISLSLGLGATYYFLFMIIPLTILLDALPISFSGLGTRDAVMIYFLGLLALSAELAVAFSLMIFLVDYILPGIIGMAVWSRNPIKRGGKPKPWAV